jgi:hypothetical protein
VCVDLKWCVWCFVNSEVGVYSCGIVEVDVCEFEVCSVLACGRVL